MAQRIGRNTRGVRRQARAHGARQQIDRAREQGSAGMGLMLRMVPLSPDQLRRVLTACILGIAVAGVLGLARVSGATGLVADGIAHVAGNAGFKVRHVEVRGLSRLSRVLVDERALGQADLAMTRFDPAALREELLLLPWVRDARVSRQLPDRLVIDIVERVPHAVLARAGRSYLIDAEGVVLAPAGRDDGEGLLRLGGEGVQNRVGALARLLDRAPALRQKVAAADWVGDRRWDLTFETGQRLALPEGEQRAAAALISFARADGVHRLIGGDVVSFDLRNPPRLYMRVPGREENAAIELGAPG